jgi:hypothetical protein
VWGTKSLNSGTTFPKIFKFFKNDFFGSICQTPYGPKKTFQLDNYKTIPFQMFSSTIDDT